MQFAFGKNSWVTYTLAAVFFLAVQHPTAAETPFRGFYASVQAGYETYDLDVQSRNLAADDLDLSGLSGGFYAGANTAVPGFDRAIIGLEGSFTLNGGDGSVSGGGDRISIDSRHTYGISARGGYKIAESVLLYGRVGWARTRFSGLDPAGRTNLDGVRFGGGAEYAITESVALRTEFTRTDYGRARFGDRRFDSGQNLLTIGAGHYF